MNSIDLTKEIKILNILKKYLKVSTGKDEKGLPFLLFKSDEDYELLWSMEEYQLLKEWLETEELTARIFVPNKNGYITVDFFGKTVSELKRNKNKIIVPKENIVIHSDFQLTEGTYLAIIDRNISDYFVYKVNEKNIILLKPEFKHCNLYDFYNIKIKESENDK